MVRLDAARPDLGAATEPSYLWPIALWCHLLDQGLWDACADLFAVDGVLIRLGRRYEGRDRIRRLLGDCPASGERHLTMNSVATTQGDGPFVVSTVLHMVTSKDGSKVDAVAR